MSRGAGIGIGLKAEHVAAVLSPSHGLDFVEVHAENYMVAGGPRLRQLEAVRRQMPLSIHGVGLSLGGQDALDAAHLERLAVLVERFDPMQVSEHLAWSTHDGVFFNDLLPVAYDTATLQRVCAHVDQVQMRLGRRLLLENPSTYVAFEASTWDEADFMSEVVRRTGCGLLLDVNNAHVSAVNHGRVLSAWLDAMPLHAVEQIHLAGFAEGVDADGRLLLIDHHGAPVHADVWALYRTVMARIGPRPTLLERDNDVPAFEVLVAEARQARHHWPDAHEAGVTDAPAPAAATLCREAA